MKNIMSVKIATVAVKKATNTGDAIINNQTVEYTGSRHNYLVGGTSVGERLIGVLHPAHRRYVGVRDGLHQPLGTGCWVEHRALLMRHRVHHPVPVLMGWLDLWDLL